MSAKDPATRKDVQGQALSAMNTAANATKTSGHNYAKPRPAYVGANGQANFARRNG